MLKLMQKYKLEIGFMNMVYYVLYVIMMNSKSVWWECALLCLSVTFISILYLYLKELEVSYNE